MTCGRIGKRDRASRFGSALGLAGLEVGCRCRHASAESFSEAMMYLRHCQQATDHTDCSGTQHNQ